MKHMMRRVFIIAGALLLLIPLAGNKGCGDALKDAGEEDEAEVSPAGSEDAGSGPEILPDGTKVEDLGGGPEVSSPPVE